MQNQLFLFSINMHGDGDTHYMYWRDVTIFPSPLARSKPTRSYLRRILESLLFGLFFTNFSD